MLRVSAISFLNTAPLMWDFEHGSAGRDFEISYTVPSLCAEALQAGAADIGIIPAITYATIPNLVILGDVAIAARGAVRSILLVSRKPLDQVRSIATDSSSRTSVVLLRILLAKLFGDGHQLVTMSPLLPEMLERCEAALVIGDSALRVDRSKYIVYDLAEEWHRLTGKAFVFAFWAIRLPALSKAPHALDLARVFRDSREHGLQPGNLSQLAREWAPRVGISESEVRTYLASNIRYYLDTEALDGLELFLKYAAEHGVISQVPELRFIGAPLASLVR